MAARSPVFIVKAAISQVIARMTVVRIAVARLELISATPIFASTAVRPAKTAERRAQENQFIAASSPGDRRKAKSRRRPCRWEAAAFHFDLAELDWARSKQTSVPFAFRA